MGDQQQTDEFTIYGILPESSARARIRLEEYRKIVTDYLQLGPIYQVNLGVFEEEFNLQLQDKSMIDIKTIYKSFNTLKFLKEVPPFLNNRVTMQNIRIIKTAIHLYSLQLLSFQDIRDATMIFQLKEQEIMSEGLPLDIQTITSMLWKINKAISVKVLEQWIKKCSDFLQVKNFIQTHEFLYLIANTVNRREYFERIPKAVLDISRDPKFKLFSVDQTGLHNLKNPDQKIQNYMNYQFNLENATFQGRSMKDKSEQYQQKRLQRNELFMKNKFTDKSDFKNLLKDPELYVEIKTKLKNAQQLLNHSKLNGKLQRVDEESIIEQQDKQKYKFNVEKIPEEYQKLSLIENLRNQKNYQTDTTKRPKSAVNKQLKNEVEQLRVQSLLFVTDLTQRSKISCNKSASSLNVNGPKKQIQTSQRAMTAKGNPSRIKKENNPRINTFVSNITDELSECKQQIISTLDEELSNFENLEQSESNRKKQKLVFYGSVNSNKYFFFLEQFLRRLYSINVPWSGTTKATI